MPELDVEHFRGPNYQQDQEYQDPNAGSVEAPQRPAALDEIGPDQALEGEVLPAVYDSSIPTIQPARLTPLQRIDFSQIDSRRELMRELNAILPLNEYNLPRYFYRADLLDYRQFNEPNPEIEQLLEPATTHLEYIHGYPTDREGKPYWAQLPYETIEAYGAFTAYLEVPGVRTLEAVPSYSPGVMAEWFHVYNWHFRAKAYDMFRTTHHSRMRIHRIMATEDDHYLESQKIFGALTRAFGNKTNEELAEMTPGEIVSSLEKVARLQRISAGLPATGPDQKTEQQTSVEVQMRAIAKQEGQTHAEDDEIDTLALLQSPDALEAAQELIIKVNRK